MYDRQKIGMIAAEVVGTFMLAMVVLSTISFFSFSAPWYAAVSVGLTLALLVHTIGKVSGAHVNPAITLGLWTLKKVSTPQALVYVSAQFIGGSLALFFYEYVTNTNTASASVPFDSRIFIAEVVGTAVFAFGVASAVTQKLEGWAAAYTVGFSLFLGVLVASVAAPGFLNPAVALSAGAWNWTVVLAPLLGSVAGMHLYALLFAPKSSLVSRSKKRK